MKEKGRVYEKRKIDLSKLIEEIKKTDKNRKTGAIAFFVGVVRGEGKEDIKVKNLTLEAYEDKANEVLQTICQDMNKKSGIVDVQIHHLLGDFNVGEDMVYVSVAGAHRKEVFQTLQETVERYKNEAPIFKKERTINKQGIIKEKWVSEGT